MPDFFTTIIWVISSDALLRKFRVILMTAVHAHEALYSRSFWKFLVKTAFVGGWRRWVVPGSEKSMVTGCCQVFLVISMGSASASPRKRFEAPLDQIWLIAFWGRSNTMLLLGTKKAGYSDTRLPNAQGPLPHTYTICFWKGWDWVHCDSQIRLYGHSP
jgi:hypothetical protein